MGPAVQGALQYDEVRKNGISSAAQARMSSLLQVLKTYPVVDIDDDVEMTDGEAENTCKHHEDEYFDGTKHNSGDKDRLSIPEFKPQTSIIQTSTYGERRIEQLSAISFGVM